MTALTRMPFTLQHPEDSYCVPCALTSIAKYYGLHTSKEDIIKLVKAHKTRGTDLRDAGIGIRKLGLKFQNFRFTYQNVHKSITEKTPILVAYMMDKGASHVGVIISCGKDFRSTEYVTLNDPYFGLWKVPFSVLKVLMSEAGSWSRQVVRI